MPVSLDPIDQRDQSVEGDVVDLPELTKMGPWSTSRMDELIVRQI